MKKMANDSLRAFSGQIDPTTTTTTRVLLCIGGLHLRDLVAVAIPAATFSAVGAREAKLTTT